MGSFMEKAYTGKCCDFCELFSCPRSVIWNYNHLLLTLVFALKIHTQKYRSTQLTRPDITPLRKPEGFLLYFTKRRTCCFNFHLSILSMVKPNKHKIKHPRSHKHMLQENLLEWKFKAKSLSSKGILLRWFLHVNTWHGVYIPLPVPRPWHQERKGATTEQHVKAEPSAFLSHVGEGRLV